MRLAIILLPFIALLIVGSAVSVAVFVRDDDGGPAGAATPESTREPTATPTATLPSTRPRLDPEGSVCQGILHVPDPNEPRVFAAEYTQKREVLGFTIVAIATVPPEALDIAVATVEDVFLNEETRAPLVEAGAYIVVADRGQSPEQLPEFECLVEEYGENIFDHICGIADRADYPLVSVNAADLLGEPGGPCRGLNVLYHELGHLVHGWVISPNDYIETRILYQAAMDAGNYGRRAYAMTNPGEYFAEGTQAYFTENDRVPSDADWLRANDPDLYALMEATYGMR